ncbi:hypothetical protein UU7_09525 [Rhodanobacter spathiphylli B39]|uniref:Uncharacterized protein n=1 Tax=Rhodanobacter spathiphylli B39 TaxID=1163407 RepID=I4W176_9GAMM|nr:hypothetical protein UU7_09525 [Rhodanobacter spathiphylli B39]
MPRRGLAHHQRRRRPLCGERGDEQALDLAGLAQAFGVDQQAAIQIEELEEAPVQGAEALQRIARVADLENVLVAARQQVDEGASAADMTGGGRFVFQGRSCSRSSERDNARPSLDRCHPGCKATP